jgi:hypothetical protein
MHYALQFHTIQPIYIAQIHMLSIFKYIASGAIALLATCTFAEVVLVPYQAPSNGAPSTAVAPNPSAPGSVPHPITLATNLGGQMTKKFECAVNAIPVMNTRPAAAPLVGTEVGLALKQTDPLCRKAKPRASLQISLDEGKSWVNAKSAKSGLQDYKESHATTLFTTTKQQLVVRFYVKTAREAAYLGPYLVTL